MVTQRTGCPGHTTPPTARSLDGLGDCPASNLVKRYLFWLKSCVHTTCADSGYGILFAGLAVCDLRGREYDSRTVDLGFPGLGFEIEDRCLPRPKPLGSPFARPFRAAISSPFRFRAAVGIENPRTGASSGSGSLV